MHRISAASFGEFKLGKHYLNESKFAEDVPSDFQPEVKERTVTLELEKRTYRCFRKDLRLPNGDYVIAKARILDTPRVIPDLPTDIRMIVEILNSIEPISP